MRKQKGLKNSDKVTVTIWGARGFCGKRTACVSLATQKRVFVCDAGTGIYFLGKELARSKTPITILLSHYHWDHIFGLPDFEPLHQKGRSITIAGPATPLRSCRRIISNIMCDPYFPFTADAWKADLHWHNLKEGIFHLDGATISARKTHHRNGAMAYQFFFPAGKRLVYATDHELVRVDHAFAKWIHGADLLIHDAQYDKKSYAKHRGWGHSTFEDVLALALHEKVKHLVLFHHPPDMTDRDLKKRLQWCRKEIRRQGKKLVCDIAKEGKTIFV